MILISIYKRIGALSKISKVLSHSLINRSAFVSIFLTGVFVMGPIGHTDYFGLSFGAGACVMIKFCILFIIVLSAKV